MDERKHLILTAQTLIAAVVLGVVGDVLLYDTDWGIGFTIFVLALITSAALLYRNRLAPLSSSIAWLALPGLAFAACLAWRDSDSLKLLNITAVLLVGGIALLRRQQGNLRLATLVDYPLAVISKWVEVLPDFGYLISLEGQWSSVAKLGAGKQAIAVGRGIVIAVPLVLVFGSLFMSADAGFERLVTGIFRIDAEAFWMNGLTIAACTWVSGGFLRRLLLAPESGPARALEMVPPLTESSPNGLLEVATVLGFLIVLFGVFVGTQLPHFFGAVHLQTMSLANWARRGFFELAAVSGLALPVLVGAESILRKNGVIKSKLFNTMAVVMIGLLMVVMLSAAYRMQLYVSVFGVTMLRIYVLVLIAWFAFVFIWFTLTVLRAEPLRFAFGGLASLLAGILALNVMNPEAVVARINLTRPANTVDAAYLNTLSIDAAPAIAANLDRVGPKQRQELLKGLKAHGEQLARSDWRAWNLDRLLARQALASLATEIERLPEQTEP